MNYLVILGYDHFRQVLNESLLIKQYGLVLLIYEALVRFVNTIV